MRDTAEKTNVMRILDKSGIPYKTHFYSSDGALPGTEVAKQIGADPDRVFKTLVTRGRSGNHYVFVIPVGRELDLKKAAAAVKEKDAEMIPQKELFPLTGYVHGGCSPIGMKKRFRTVADQSAEHLDTVIFSAGKIGAQVEITPSDLKKATGCSLSNICRD